MAAAGLFQQLQKRLPNTYSDRGWYLVAAAAAAAHNVPSLLPEIWNHATLDLGPPAASRGSTEIDWDKDIPRRQVARQLKEALIKSTILVGVASCIECAFALGSVLDEGDKDDVFIRKGFDTDGQALGRGEHGLDRIYGKNNKPIHDKMGQLGLQDIQWLGRAVTYGSILTPTRPEFAGAALTPEETQLVSLTCLMARKSPRQVMWHLRGCVSGLGMPPDVVEQCRMAIDYCNGQVAGMAQATMQMPTVDDVRDFDVQ